VVAINQRPNFWPLGWNEVRSAFMGVLSRQKGFSLNKTLNAILWDNTRPMKGTRTIRFMNEHSFTFLLALSSASIGRECQTISSRFATATLEGL
jgi:hypothetical protein